MKIPQHLGKTIKRMEIHHIMMFDELECDVDAIESEVAQLIIKSQDYNVSEDKFEYLSVALENLQNFRKEMEKGRENCREAYSK